MAVLVTGGTGFIGSHTVVELLNDGREVIILDNLSNSKECVLDRIEQITGKRPVFRKIDLLDFEGVQGVFREFPQIDSVIHFAGLKAVGESVAKPMLYYHNNLTGTLNLCRAMAEANVKRIVFSSSATVYGKPESVPIREDFPLHTTNPYGETKLVIERILADITVSDPEWSVSVLRYFNPIGAHESGLIGEDPKGIPNNLMPYISQVAVGRREKLTVFGNDYATPDGTCRRDYIHVMDLANGHVKAVEYAANAEGVNVFNLGTGTPYSVLEIINSFEKASGVRVAYEFGPRREGDLPEFWADASKASECLGWKPERNLDDMCRDSWNWQKNNPFGYGKK